MSSILQTLKLVGRQRLVSPVSRVAIRHSQQHRARKLSIFAPPKAYRRQPPPKRGGNNNKRKPVKKIGKGRDGLWKHLQETYVETLEKDKQNDTKQRDDDENAKFKKQFRRQEQLQNTQQEFKAVLYRYRNKLFPKSASKRSKKSSGIRLLQNLHQLCENAANDEDATARVSLETLVETESQFQDLGKLIRELIALTCRMPFDDEEEENKPQKNSVVAEDLLRGLLTLKQDRALLYKKAMESRQEQVETQQQEGGGLMGWIKNVFVFSPGDNEATDMEADNNDSERPKVMVHEEASFGPNKKQFAQVMKSIRKETKDLTWKQHSETVDETRAIREEAQPAQAKLIECARRMTALMELHLESGGEPVSSVTTPPLVMYSRVGSLQAANEAKRIYVDVCIKKVPRPLFHFVLKAYQMAAFMEDDPKARGEAATTAMALLEERERYSLANAHFGVPDGSDPRGKSYSLVLQALCTAGRIAVPDQVVLAETLLQRFLGEPVFNQVIHYKKTNTPSKVDMSVFEYLLLMYTSRGDVHKNLRKAKNILMCAQDQRAVATSKQSSSLGDTDVFPSASAYNAVLKGIRSNVIHNQNLTKAKRATVKVETSKEIVKNEVMDGLSIFDSMPETCPPNLRTFELILDILAIAEMPESLQRAEEILSRMSIQQACSGSSDEAWFDSSRVSAHVLRCIASSPSATSADGLSRALRILDRMEASTGILYQPPPGTAREEKDIFDSVYEMGETKSYGAAYNEALKICSRCVDDAETAFEAAFDIYNRMIAVGASPNEDTFSSLFECCQLPGKDNAAMERRQEMASTVIAFAADYGVDTRKMAKKMRKMNVKTSKQK